MLNEHEGRLIEELIQVAAVAVAAVEDLRHGVTDRSKTEDVFTDIHNERVRQDEKWGAQRHNPTFWMGILGEEFGEACQEALRCESEVIAEADRANRRFR